MQPAVNALKDIGLHLARLQQQVRPWDREDKSEVEQEADSLAHKFLTERLTSHFPGLPVVSEEDREHTTDRPKDYFLIDPIDGTASWSGGFEGYVCQLARIKDSEVVFGAIYAPATKMTWTATRGQGAFLNGQPLALPEAAVSQTPVVVDNFPTPRGIAAELRSLFGTFEYVESGSIGLKAALVATGKADLFIKDVVVRDWDVAPALALMQEVGGYVANYDGSKFLLTDSYEKPDGVIFARTSQLGKLVVDWLRSRNQ